jgi:glutamyl-Q tRNA(Asp) synthetase
MAERAYRGRFAPTPSGPLHFGSLVAATASFLEARTRGGEWLVRMEDLDPPRVVPGAADDILRTLDAFGFEWEGEVVHQGRRSEAYRAALEALDRAGSVYPCTCSRKLLAETAKRGVDGPVYPGTCRGRHGLHGSAALRLRLPETRIVFEDGLQGRVACDVAAECGDFVLRRADGAYGYQLAVVVDDAAQGITHVVRGADLLTSTPRQIVLQHHLDLATPAYLHLPVVLDERGEKLGKQTLATPVDPRSPLPALGRALAFLGMRAHPTASVTEFWAMAREGWDPPRLPPVRGKRLRPAGWP